MEHHVFVLAPSGKDAALLASALERSHFEVCRCATAAEVVEHAPQGIGTLLVAEEALHERGALATLHRLVERQPSWSDLPVLLLTTRGGRLSELAASAMELLGNVTVLERPTQVATLVGAARTALRTRSRQYEMRLADTRKDLFLATLAHELRNPLAPLSNALHLLQSGVAPAHPRQRWATGVMQRQVAQLSRLVDDLLDVARITRGKITLQTQRFDLRDAIHAGVETALPLVDAMAHRIVFDLPPMPVWVEGDRTRLAQCVSNLVSNAAKYTPRGGCIEVCAPVLDGREVEVQVRDNGIGFPPHEARRLFDVFAQVDGALPRAQGGLGLGLSIVKALIELHGGSVFARSDGEGRGSLFTLRLPLSAAAEPAAAADAAVADGLPACRVLVVDDNRDSADSMSEVLQAFGHEVRIAYCAGDGLNAIETWTPHLALLDIGLPDMSGHELARRLRARLGDACPVLVAITGWGQAIDVARSAEAGFDHHLTKPADIDAVRALIRGRGRMLDGASAVALPASP